jgi:hypothetical protein
MKRIYISLAILIAFGASYLPLTSQDRIALGKEKTKLLESYGLLSSSSLYLSYLSLTYIEKSIGAADAPKDVNSIIESIQNIDKLIKNDIDKLKQKVNLADEDKEYMDSMVEIAELLLDDSAALKKFANSKKEEDRRKFLEKHSAIFEKMNHLFYGDKSHNEETERSSD